MPHKANPVLSVLVRRAALTTPQLAATLHLAAAAAVDERPDGALARRVGDAARPWSPHGRRRRADHRPAGRPGGARRPDGRHPRGRRRRRAAPSSAAWPSWPGATRPRRLPRHRRPPRRGRPRPARRDATEETAMTPHVTAVRLTGAARPRRAAAAGPRALARHVRHRPLGRLRARLTDAFDVVAWDLPGHGHNRSVPDEPFDRRARRRRAPWSSTMLGRARRRGRRLLLRRRLRRRRRRAAAAARRPGPGRRGGAALHRREGSASAECWLERIDQVRASGTPVMVERLRPALVRAGLPRARPRPRLRPAARAAGRRRRRLRRGLRRPRGVRRTPPARRDRHPRPRGRRLGRRARPRPARCARSPTASGTGASSSSTASPTSPRPRLPTRWPACSASTSWAVAARDGTAPSPRSAPPAWRSAGRCSATPTWTAPPRRHRPHPRLPGVHHRVRLGRASGPGPASTGAAGRWSR